MFSIFTPIVTNRYANWKGLEGADKKNLDTRIQKLFVPLLILDIVAAVALSTIGISAAFGKIPMGIPASYALMSLAAIELFAICIFIDLHIKMSKDHE